MLQLLTQFIYDSIHLLIFLDVSHQRLGDVFKPVFFKVRKLITEASNGIREEVVDDLLAFAVKFVQEKLHLVLDLLVGVVKKHADVDNLSFYFEHVIQDQVGYNHQGLPSDVTVIVMQKHKHVVSVSV